MRFRLIKEQDVARDTTLYWVEYWRWFFPGWYPVAVKTTYEEALTVLERCKETNDIKFYWLTKW